MRTSNSSLNPVVCRPLGPLPLIRSLVKMERWSGKVAIVTGASSGIGAAIAESLVRSGLKVVGLARRKERIEEAALKLCGEPGKLYALKADLTKEEEILQAFQWVEENLGSLHILVNNAGLSKSTTLIDGKTEDFKQILDTNVLALAIATREAVKIMRKHDIDGHIVHINSLAGHQVLPVPNVNVYSASKFAVTALAETLRRELAAIKSKIKITSVSPGYTETEIFEANGFLENELAAHMLKILPSIKSEDVANAVMYVLGTPPHVQVTELTIRPVCDPV